EVNPISSSIETVCVLGRSIQNVADPVQGCSRLRKSNYSGLKVESRVHVDCGARVRQPGEFRVKPHHKTADQRPRVSREKTRKLEGRWPRRLLPIARSSVEAHQRAG